MAAPVYQSVGTGIRNPSANDVVVAAPAGIVAGDLLVAFIAADWAGGGAPTHTDPGGWDNLYNQEIVDFQGTGNSYSIWTKEATLADESTVDYTFAFNDNEEGIGMILRITGNDVANPVNVSEKDLADKTGGLPQPTAPDAVTTADDCLVLRFYAHGDGLLSADWVPAGHTGVANISSDNTTPGGGSCQGGCAYQTQAAPGNTGTAQFTSDALAEVEGWTSNTVAIAPAAVSGPGMVILRRRGR